MALTVLPPPSDDVGIDVHEWLGVVAGFVAGAIIGFALMAVLSLLIWPALFPYSDNLLQGSGLAVSVFTAVICGIAGVVMAAAKQSAR